MQTHRLTHHFRGAAIPDRTYATALKVAAWLLILTHGEPDLIGSVVSLVGRLP